MTQWRDMADRLTGKAPPGTRRSGKWRSFRNEILRGKCCAICSSERMICLHHIISFSLAPDLECEPSNCIPLCQSKKYGINCHLLIGHLGNWRRINVNVRADVAYWHERLRK